MKEGLPKEKAMKTHLFIPICLAALFLLTGCTQQEMAKNWGGTATTELPACKKLVTVTWKETNLWFLYRNMRPGEPIEQYQFQESSSLGFMEGTVILQERRDSSCPQ